MELLISMDDSTFPAERGAPVGALPLLHCKRREEEEQVWRETLTECHKSKCGKYVEAKRNEFTVSILKRDTSYNLVCHEGRAGNTYRSHPGPGQTRPYCQQLSGGGC